MLTIHGVSTAQEPSATCGWRSPECLKLNTNGHIPSVEDDGLVLHELLAINLDMAPRSMAVHGNLAEDALMTMWALWAVAGVGEGFFLGVN